MKLYRSSGLAAAALFLLVRALPAEHARATFAGGCFWCMEETFEQLPGVRSATSGFTGGSVSNPTYAQVGAGTTGHAEGVEVVFDPAKITYEKLVDAYWQSIDPLAVNGQFCDRGEQYRTVIFFHDEEQRRIAEASKKRVERRLNAKVATQILPASPFYPADLHQQGYAKKNAERYAEYRKGCGRDELLRQIWGVTPLEAPEKP